MLVLKKFYENVDVRVPSNNIEAKFAELDRRFPDVFGN